MKRSPFHTTLFGFTLLVAYAFAPAPSNADKEKTITLTISAASAVKTSDGDTTISLSVLVNNNMGWDVAVESNFGSALDSLDLIVTGADGKLLARQSYSFHQSPHLKPRKFLVKSGETATRMVFPLPEFGRVGDKFSLRLIGILPGPDLIVSSAEKPTTLKGH